MLITLKAFGDLETEMAEIVANTYGEIGTCFTPPVGRKSATREAVRKLNV